MVHDTNGASWWWAMWCSNHVEVDDVIYVLQNKTYVYQVGHNYLIYIMMHGQKI
jgi:hypothetical protein